MMNKRIESLQYKGLYKGICKMNEILAFADDLLKVSDSIV